MKWISRLDECDRLIAAEDWDGLRKYVNRHWRDASDWVTCACGEQDARIPRGSKGAPLDAKLEGLGLSFASDWGEIKHDRSTTRARATLAAIEQRAAEILQEQPT